MFLVGFGAFSFRFLLFVAVAKRGFFWLLFALNFCFSRSIFRAFFFNHFLNTCCFAAFFLGLFSATWRISFFLSARQRKRAFFWWTSTNCIHPTNCILHDSSAAFNFVGKKVWNYKKRCLHWYPSGSLAASQRKHFWQTSQSGCQNSTTGAPGTMVNINMQNYRAIAIRLISMSCF